MNNKNAIAIFNTAVEAVKPALLIRKHIYWDGMHLKIAAHQIHKKYIDKVVVIAIGKAASLMAQTIEGTLGDLIYDGIVVTKYNHTLPLQYLKTIEAGHPIPDENSIEAGKAVLKLLQQRNANDIVITLISGGASALMADVPFGISLADLQHTSQLLLNAGATIHEINSIRKHISNIKGGWLAVHAQPATVFSLILSDVVGDDVDVIASGPTVADSSSFADAMTIITKLQLTETLPTTVKAHLMQGLQATIPETPKANHIAFSNTHNIIIGSNAIALQAAYDKAITLGYETHIIADNITGNVNEVADSFVRTLQAHTSTKPLCLLMGGETTVNIVGNGKGGRNQQFALAAGLSTHFTNALTVLSCGTDGTDGPTDAAGACIDATILHNATAEHLNATDYLQNNDAYHFFEKAGGLIKTGPTQTNVMDIMIGIRNGNLQ